MKLIALFLTLTLFHEPPATLIVVDRNLKTPPGYTDDFTIDDYFKRNFPIYSADVDVVIKAAQKTAKIIDQRKEYNGSDTIKANQTTFILTTKSEEEKTVTVRLITVIEEKDLSFEFVLVRKEDDNRQAQRKLIDFATYLTN
jgi:hypothetical protein